MKDEDNNKLNESMLKIGIMQSNIEHLSDRLDKLYDQIENKVCSQIESTASLLEKIHLRMQEEMVHRISTEKALSKINEDILHITYIQKSNEKLLKEHDHDISKLKDAENAKKAMLSTSKAWVKGICAVAGATISFCFAIGGAIYAYLESQKTEAETKATVAIHEIDEKKKRLEYNRERYLIRNGKWKDGEVNGQ